jgi:hypothetical protein
MAGGGEVRGRDWVAILLAVGIATALNVIVVAVLWTAVTSSSDVDGGLSENATQIITGAFGGILGVLGAYLGFRAGEQHAKRLPGERGEPEPNETGADGD